MSAYTCFSADSLHLLCCITPCENWDVFLGYPVYRKSIYPVVIIWNEELHGNRLPSSDLYTGSS